MSEKDLPDKPSADQRSVERTKPAGGPAETGSSCQGGLAEEWLSGYLDQALTQGEEQRVRIHLEDCAHCRALYEDFRTLREVTMTTRFDIPTDDQWSEEPRGTGSRVSFRLGWFLLILWAVGFGGFALWQVATEPGDLVPKLLAFGGISGFFFLFVSVLLDRLGTLKNDRYRRVQK